MNLRENKITSMDDIVILTELTTSKVPFLVVNAVV